MKVFAAVSSLLGPALTWLVLLSCAPLAQAATITVDTLVDSIAADAACSLREALLNSQNNDAGQADCDAGSGVDLITFDAALFSGTPPQATLTLDPGLGTLEVLGDGVHLAPPAGHRLRLAGDHTFRLIRVSMFAEEFVIRDIELAGGHAPEGGAVRLNSLGLARFERVHFVDNTADDGGGALYSLNSSNFSPLQIELVDCRFVNNRSPTGFGGALYVIGEQATSITVDGCSFLGNESRNGGAVYVDVRRTTAPALGLSIENSVFENNRSNVAGAGAALRVQGFDVDSVLQALIRNNRFASNRALSRGAAIVLHARATAPPGLMQYRVERNSFLHNRAERENLVGGPAEGGAILLDHAEAQIVNNLLLDNVAEAAGAGLLGDFGQLEAAREVQVVGNSFYHNESLLQHNGPNLLVRPPAGGATLKFELLGNLFAVHPMNGEGDCEIGPGGSGFLLMGGYNLSDRDCGLGPGSAGVEDVGVAPTALGHPIHATELSPDPLGPAVDFWPTLDCVDPDGGALTEDLLGAIRPAEGDGIAPAACDAGAFERPAAALANVQLQGDGSGRVFSQPPGIDCPGVCTYPFPIDTGATLFASADPGSVFVLWDDDCSGTGDCVVLGAVEVAAIFALAPTRSLTVALEGDGQGSLSSAPAGIACPPQCVASFSEGSDVTLTPSAAANSVFDGYGGGGCIGTGTCTVIMDADRTVPASFSAVTSLLEVTLSGSGSGRVLSTPVGIDCPGDCAQEFPRSDIVTLQASVDNGSLFLGWEGDCDGDGDCVLDMDLGPYAVAARFDQIKTLSVHLQGQGSGVVTSDPAGIDCPGDCVATYPSSASVLLTAQPDAGSVFNGWGGNCSGGVNCTLSMASNRSATAHFGTTSNLLQVEVLGGGRVTSSPAGIDCPGTCSAEFATGTEITLQTEPDTGFDFVGWGGVCSGSGTCSFTLSAPNSVSAEFVQSVSFVFADGFE